MDSARLDRPIRMWVEDERPRELLAKEGAEKLNCAKLLAILLGTGCKGCSAEELARRLLNRFGSIRKLDSASFSELCAVEGVGLAKAAQIKSALELGKRFSREKARKLRSISSPSDVMKYVSGLYSPYLGNSDKEQFSLILVDNRNRPISNIELCRGSSVAAIVDTREVLGEALRNSASGIVLVHNHPCGDPEPSPEDIAMTDSVMKACEVVGLRFIDHIIILNGRKKCTSFMEKGLLKL